MFRNMLCLILVNFFSVVFKTLNFLFFLSGRTIVLREFELEVVELVVIARTGVGLEKIVQSNKTQK